MEVDNSESVSVESSNRFLNKAFIKGFLAGIVIGFVAIPFLIIGNMFGFNQVDALPDWTYFVINCVLPMLLIYFAGKVVTFALGRYGFEGWEKYDLLTFFGTLLGIFVAAPVVIFVISFVSYVVKPFIVPGG